MIYRNLCERSELGELPRYTGSYDTLWRYVRQLKVELSPREAFLELETPAGFDAQCDWCKVPLKIADKQIELSMFVLKLSYSRYRYARLYCMERQECFFDGHLRAVIAIGGLHELLVELEARIVGEVVVINEARGARREPVFAVEKRRWFVVGPRGRVVVKPLETGWVIREVRKNIALLHFELVVRDVLRVDELDAIETFGMVDQDRASETIHVSSRDKPHSPFSLELSGGCSLE